MFAAVWFSFSLSASEVSAKLGIFCPLYRGITCTCRCDTSWLAALPFCWIMLIPSAFVAFLTAMATFLVMP